MQTVDYEQIPFKCKYCHEYGHFANFCTKNPDKSNVEESPKEGWNVASKKRGARGSPMHPSTSSAKNATGNKFQALANEEIEVVELLEGQETKIPQEEEAPMEMPPLGPNEQADKGTPA